MVWLADVLVREDASLRKALETITRSGKQVAVVVDGETRLLGLLTDGDVRKAILRGLSLEADVQQAMNRNPVVARAGIGTVDAITFMRSRSIRHLPVLDARRGVVELLWLDELLAAAPPLQSRAVIMAGGEGTRLFPVTESVPKPLVRIGGKPLLEILIERLRGAGIVEFLIAVHHKSAMIREQLGDGSRLGARIDYVEEPVPLGTMGSLTLARERLDAPFFVVNGDILTKCDFRAMWDFHRSQPGAAMTVGVSLHQVEIPYGEFTLRGTRVMQMLEKPRKEYPVNAGIYVLDPSVVDMIPVGQYFDAPELIHLLLSKDRIVAAHVIREYWLDVGRHPDLDKANRDVAEGLLE